ncbi:hypothetical protein IE53DRAFT_384509 [Violaceomyces palustris]|uniref:Uncharacterized protein n=1 Tax=Violaceomyces palustris TaxID=1673888 RepID=A0ACD0P4W1_9BASI|nr:hypothetical protein IE53DRAFT_384509 [Violaceomyces palustris]
MFPVLHRGWWQFLRLLGLLSRSNALDSRCMQLLTILILVSLISEAVQASEEDGIVSFPSLQAPQCSPCKSAITIGLVRMAAQNSHPSSFASILLR